jgi:hypothetical protein
MIGCQVITVYVRVALFKHGFYNANGPDSSFYNSNGPHSSFYNANGPHSSFLQCQTLNNQQSINNLYFSEDLFIPAKFSSLRFMYDSRRKQLEE